MSAASSSLHGDVRAALLAVLADPQRRRRLLALGPRGLVAMARFLLSTIPRASAELRAFRGWAAAIPDPLLRAQALASIADKAFHVQGGCIFATFLPRVAARRYVAIVAALETIYDYLDNLCDRMPEVAPRAYATLHDALLDALDDRRTPGDAYRDGPFRDDGGYLRMLVTRVRGAIVTLPHYAAIRERLIDTARAYVTLQRLKHLPRGARETACRAWHVQRVPHASDLRWWEFASACGSSLPVFALLFAASNDNFSPGVCDALLDAYVPGVSAVHILLDYYIDQAEDREHRELNFVACYPDRDAALARLATLIRRGRAGIIANADDGAHTFVYEAMCLFYLSHPKIFAQGLAHESAALLAALDDTPLSARPFARAS